MRSVSLDRQSIGILGLSRAMSNYNIFIIFNIHQFNNQLALHAQLCGVFKMAAKIAALSLKLP